MTTLENTFPRTLAALLWLCAGAITTVPPAAAAIAAAARAERPPPGHTRTLMVPRVTQAPVIDGRLDDPAWQDAPVADRFWVSDQQRAPAEQTEVMVAADGEHLYFAFRVFDSRPESIEALQTRRNVGLGVDDQVGVELDTYFNRREVSTYAVNPRGTQYDDVAYGRADKIGWRGDWHAAAVRTDYGWSAEIAIPFSVLNYQSGGRIFGVNFIRYHNRAVEWSRWADITPQYKVEEMGQLTGLELPPRAKPQPWTFMPYALAGRNIPDRRGKPDDVLVAAGIDIRYEPRRNVTGVVSLHPDFSQIETQFTNINFAYTEKVRADARPFFQEGAHYFGSDAMYFYSNRIPDFDYGGKLFAQLGAYQLGVLATHAPDERSDVVLRAVRELDATHSAGLTVVTTDRRGLSNQLVAAQFGGRQPSGVNYAADLAATHTEEPGGDGSRWRGMGGWRGDHWSVGATLDRVGLAFLPANGLLRSDLPGTRGVSGFASYQRALPAGPARVINGSLVWTGRNTDDGRTQTRNWFGGGSVELRSPQIRAGLFRSEGHYRPNAGAPGLWTETVNRDRYWTASVDLNTRSSWLGYGISYSSGFVGGADYRYVAPYAWIRPTARTWLNVTTERLEHAGEFDQTIVSARWDVTDQDALAIRTVTADGQHFVRLAYARQVRSGLDIFAVYEAGAEARPRLSLKVMMTYP